MDSNRITEPTCAPALATLRVVKTVVNTGNGTAIPSNFMISVKNATGGLVGGPTSGTGMPGTPYSLPSGNFTVSEVPVASYGSAFSGDCNTNGIVSLAPGDTKTCIVTNTYVPAAVNTSGGGGAPRISIDDCPNGDFSSGYYDDTCGTAPVVTKTGTPVIVPLIGIRKVPTPLALPL